MNEYRLQTELSDEERREMALYSEKYEIQTEIRNQRKKTSEKVRSSANASALMILVYALVDFLSPGPIPFMLFMFLSLGHAAEMIWVSYVSYKQQLKLEHCQTIIDETEIQKLINR